MPSQRRPPTPPYRRAAQTNLANELQTATLNMFSDLSPTRVAIYSSACMGHCLSMLPEFTTFTVNGKTMASTLSAWYFDGQSSIREIEARLQPPP